MKNALMRHFFKRNPIANGKASFFKEEQEVIHHEPGTAKVISFYEDRRQQEKPVVLAKVIPMFT